MLLVWSVDEEFHRPHMKLYKQDTCWVGKVYLNVQVEY